MSQADRYSNRQHWIKDSKARKDLLHAVFRACDLNSDDWLSEGEFRNIAPWTQLGGSWYLLSNCSCTSNYTYNHMRAEDWGNVREIAAVHATLEVLRSW